jgi:hypothetical protein
MVPGVSGVFGLVVSTPLRALRPFTAAGVAGEVIMEGVSEAYGVKRGTESFVASVLRVMRMLMNVSRGYRGPIEVAERLCV